MFARLRCGGNLPHVRGLGTRNRLLWYGICVPCSKRLPGVRDAFSEASGVKNRLFRYGRDTRCQKQAPGVRDAFSEAFGVKNRLFRYRRDIRCAKQPSLVRDASSKARRTPTPQTVDSPCRTGRIFRGVPCQKQHLPHRTHLQCAKRPPLSLFAPAAPSLAPSTALGTRNGPARM